MNTFHVSEQLSLPDSFASSSLLLLLKKGLDSLQQEDDSENVALLALAREQRASHHVELAAVFDTFIQEYAKYQSTRRAFQEAERCFARAHEEQRARVTTFKKTLFSLIEVIDRLHEPPDRLPGAPGHTVLPSLPSQRLPEQTPLPVPHIQTSSTLPELWITCFGRFEIRRAEQPIALCPNRNAQTILRYLVSQKGYSATTEQLLAMAWPEDEPEVARNKLYIAISALRRSLHAGLPNLPGYGYLICKNQMYLLNSAAIIRTDVEEFLHYYQMGQQHAKERIAFYEKACQYYKGSFLLEDLYADWSFLLREQFNSLYLIMCRVLAAHYLQIHRYEEAAKWATTILTWDHCDEDAHRQLMQVYAAQGYRSKAIHQYHHCERILRQELGVEPLPATAQLFMTLLQ
jgi:DNA-binding SARP family transcriptional activator